MFYWYDSNSNSFVSKEVKNSSYIPQIVWVITDKCNYRCPFCFQPKTNSDINLEQISTYIKIFEKLGVQKIDISGGEPLYFKFLIPVIETLNNNKFYLTITTNGSGLSTNRNWITSNAHLFSRIIVSLNGFNEKQQDLLCGVQGAYEKLLSFVELLKKSRCENIRINTVISSLYLKDENLNDIIQTIKNISPYEWCLIQPHPENKLPSFDTYDITMSQFDRIVHYVKTSFSNVNIRIISRSVKNYAGYWILNPDGRFILHTDGVREAIETDFSITALPEIISLSKKHGIWVPLRGNGEEVK